MPCIEARRRSVRGRYGAPRRRGRAARVRLPRCRDSKRWIRPAPPTQGTFPEAPAGRGGRTAAVPAPTPWRRCRHEPSTSRVPHAMRWAMAATRVADGGQGALRPPVGCGGARVGAQMGDLHGQVGRHRRGLAVAPAADRQRPLLRARLVVGAFAASPHRHVVGLAAAIPARGHRAGAATGRPAPGRVARRRAGPHASGDRRDHRSHRGALEPRPLRRASGSQGVSRHAAPPGAGYFALR